MSRARIFISYRQSTVDEIHIANKISNELTTLGFDIYVARESQTLKGIKEI